MLRGEGLSFRYGKQFPWLFRDLAIMVAPGELVGLTAPSGRGKTTLARVLSGYLRPTTGTITVGGAPLPARGYHPVQLIAQHPELAINPRWRIARVLAEGGPPSRAVLDALQIDRAWLQRWPHELSGGELQRIALARVLNPRTRYLIADEMTAMLDAATQAQIWHAVHHFTAAHDIGVLVISHDAALLARLCARVERLPEDAAVVPSMQV